MMRVACHPVRGDEEGQVMDEKVTGTYTVRGVSRDLHAAARLRAVSEGTTLRSVLLQALHDYAAGTWTPAAAVPAPRGNGA